MTAAGATAAATHVTHSTHASHITAHLGVGRGLQKQQRKQYQGNLAHRPLPLFAEKGWAPAGCSIATHA